MSHHIARSRSGSCSRFRRRKTRWGTPGPPANLAASTSRSKPFPLATVEKVRDQAWTAVPKVGDAAYFRDNRGNYAELAARVGTRDHNIQMRIPSGRIAESVKPNVVVLGERGRAETTQIRAHAPAQQSARTGKAGAIVRSPAPQLWTTLAGRKKHYATSSTDRSGAVKLAAPAHAPLGARTRRLLYRGEGTKSGGRHTARMRRHRVAPVLAVLALVATSARADQIDEEREGPDEGVDSGPLPGDSRESGRRSLRPRSCCWRRMDGWSWTIRSAAFSMGAPESWRPVTICQLLTHAAGLIRESPAFEPM